MSNQNGKLYVVATPIGNLSDISFRAINILQSVDLIAAEDTRHIGHLLQHFGINNKITSLHQHNEQKAAPFLIEKLLQGLSIALVSDAGTPLISDPGLPLIDLAKSTGISVSPIPGPCALMAALSASGLPVSKFSFEGFLPRTSSARKTFFQEKAGCQHTWGVYESSHRILSAIQDITDIFPGDQIIVIAREMTKLYETIIKTKVDDVLDIFDKDPNMQRGEFVILFAGIKPVENKNEILPEHIKLLSTLLKECSIKTTVSLAVEITGLRKKTLYQTALEIKKTQE